MVSVILPNQLLEIKSDAEILPVLESLKDWQLSIAEMFSWLTIE